MTDLPLGRDTGYEDTYSPGLLYAVPRADGRRLLGLGDELPFRGADAWTAYELSWLDGRGRPVVATLTFSVPADSPHLIESKSLKLYLNGFAMDRYAGPGDIERRIAADLSATTGAAVSVDLVTAAGRSADPAVNRIAELPGECIDYEEIDCERYEPEPSLLAAGGDDVTETLHSHVLRSLCPVTGQPDTGSVMIHYTGPRIDRGALLAYIASFRRHPEFHELCVERMFVDLQRECGAQQLTVYARYNRRGGIDINPFRSNTDAGVPALRLWRQ